MKKIYLSILFIAFTFITNSQNAFWTEGFGSGPCSKGQSANATIATPTNGAWAITSFSLPFMNAPYANEWYISAEEQGQPVNICGGITCGGSNNKTLHLSSNVTVPPPPIIDIGTDYESGAFYNTNKRAETPIVNCSGRYGVQLSCGLIYGGVPNFDYCDLEYSANAGVTWSVLTTMAVPNNSQCPTIGTWTTYAIGLPSSLFNNANVKIGFHWYNSDPTGGDLSIGIDDLQFSETTIATNATVACLTSTSVATISNAAIGNTSFTWAAIPNTVTFSPTTGTITNMQFPGNGTYTILAYGSELVGGVATSTAMSIVNVVMGSTPPVSAVSSASVLCTGSSAVLTASGASTYSWNTNATTSTIGISPIINTTYTVTGKIGFCTSVYTITQVVSSCAGLNELNNANSEVAFPNPFSNEITIASDGETELIMSNMIGQIVKQEKFNSKIILQTSELQNGIYILSVKTNSGIKKTKIVKE